VVSPGALPIGTSLAIRSDLVEIAASTFLEGCVGETVAALSARAQRDAATDPEARRALSTIADDVARHAGRPRT
jgi:hypothetical protein